MLLQNNEFFPPLWILSWFFRFKRNAEGGCYLSDTAHWLVLVEKDAWKWKINLQMTDTDAFQRNQSLLIASNFQYYHLIIYVEMFRMNILYTYILLQMYWNSEAKPFIIDVD